MYPCVCMRPPPKIKPRLCNHLEVKLGIYACISMYMYVATAQNKTEIMQPPRNQTGIVHIHLYVCGHRPKIKPRLCNRLEMKLGLYAYTSMSFAAAGCSWLLLAAPGGTWLSLAASGCPLLLRAAFGRPWLLLRAPGCWRPFRIL